MCFLCCVFPSLLFFFFLLLSCMHSKDGPTWSKTILPLLVPPSYRPCFWFCMGKFGNNCSLIKESWCTNHSPVPQLFFPVLGIAEIILFSSPHLFIYILEEDLTISILFPTVASIIHVKFEFQIPLYFWSEWVLNLHYQINLPTITISWMIPFLFFLINGMMNNYYLVFTIFVEKSFWWVSIFVMKIIFISFVK